MSLFNHKRMTGQTSETKAHLLLGAGVLVKDYNPATDTYETARTDKKILGATSGGSTFTATKNGHYLSIDGVPENTKGNWILDSWASTLQTTLQEITAENLKMSLAAAKLDSSDSTAGKDYTAITPKDVLEDDDYIGSLSYIGRISGSEKPVIITIFNAFNTADLSLNPKDGEEGTLAMTLTAHYSPDDPDTEPFKIYYPKISEE